MLTGNPWNRPAARFAAPSPVISRLPSISWPVRAANTEAVEIVSASDTRAMPAAPANSGPMSARRTSGRVSGGNPLGIVPTRLTPREARLNTDVAAIARTTAMRTAGSLGSQRCSTRISAMPQIPTVAAAATALPSARPLKNAAASRIRPLASILNPNSFGSWPTRMVSARPFM